MRVQKTLQELGQHDLLSD